MNVFVIKMRKRGVELPKRQWRQEMPYKGVLTIMDALDTRLYRHVKTATLKSPHGFTDSLFEPHIIWVNDGRLMLTGFERVEEGGAVVEYAQSWLCQVKEVSDEVRPIP